MAEHLFKILIVGDGSVGKSSFVHRYVNGQFSKTYKMTVGGTAALVYQGSVDWTVCLCVYVFVCMSVCMRMKCLHKDIK